MNHSHDVLTELYHLVKGCYFYLRRNHDYLAL